MSIDWGTVPIAQRLEHVYDAHKVIREKWCEHTEIKKGDFDSSDLRISTFTEKRLGRNSVFRHACGGYLCMSHEFPDKVMLWSVPEGQAVECNGCKKTIPFDVLAFAWMHSRLVRL